MSDGRAKGKPSSGDAALDEHIQKAIEELTPEQRAALHRVALLKLAKMRGVEVETKSGAKKTVSLFQFMRKANRLRKAYESGVMDETVRTVPRWQLQEATPARTLRQGSYKQQLRQREEANLELDRFGQGVVTSARPVLGTLFDGGRRDFAWGIYGRTNDAEHVLGRKWADRDPAAAAAGEDLYLDVLRRCHQMELTLIALTSRALPLAPTRAALEGRLEASMQRLAGEDELAPGHKADLQRFISMFDEKRVAPAGWMDGEGNVKEGTHFLLSTTPQGELVVEAITPGRLKERRTSRICVNSSPLVTASVFDLFLGPQPLDEEGKRDVGAGMLWAANGYRFRPWEMQPGQYVAEEGPGGRLAFPPPPPEATETMDLPLRPSVFQLLEEQTQPLRRMLLRGTQEGLERE